jgi:hypothetical protein
MLLLTEFQDAENIQLLQFLGHVAVLNVQALVAEGSRGAQECAVESFDSNTCKSLSGEKEELLASSFSV